MDNQSLYFIDEQRKKSGYMTIDQLISEIGVQNILYDPYSTLISIGTQIGVGNVIYPNVHIKKDSNSLLKIGNRNLFSSVTYLDATHGGILKIGDDNHFEGGISIKANMQNAHIVIGNNGRYINQILQVLGKTHFGSGSQVIGSITIQNSTLEDGDDFRESDPDKRGGLVKGFGTLKDTTIPRGKGIEGFGGLITSTIFDQSTKHPKK